LLSLKCKRNTPIKTPNLSCRTRCGIRLSNHITAPASRQTPQ